MRRSGKRMYRVKVEGQRTRSFRSIETAVLFAVSAARKHGKAIVIRINDKPYSYAVNAVEFYLDEDGQIQTRDLP